tara:strand:+ start:644 stop:787 length:144 start_codon:yes stop_codon:yes gene_type:complete
VKFGGTNGPRTEGTPEDIIAFVFGFLWQIRIERVSSAGYMPEFVEFG